jgi:hypothetical protein
MVFEIKEIETPDSQRYFRQTDVSIYLTRHKLLTIKQNRMYM